MDSKSNQILSQIKLVTQREFNLLHDATARIWTGRHRRNLDAAPLSSMVSTLDRSSSTQLIQYSTSSVTNAGCISSVGMRHAGPIGRSGLAFTSFSVVLLWQPTKPTLLFLVFGRSTTTPSTTTTTELAACVKRKPVQVGATSRRRATNWEDFPSCRPAIARNLRVKLTTGAYCGFGFYSVLGPNPIYTATLACVAFLLSACLVRNNIYRFLVAVGYHM